MAKKEKMDRREIEANKREFKQRYENFYKKDKKRMVRDSEYAKDAMLNNPFKEDVDPKKFHGFNQAGRIRGGLKKGGSAKGCKLAMKGKGRAYGKNS